VTELGPSPIPHELSGQRSSPSFPDKKGGAVPLSAEASSRGLRARGAQCGQGRQVLPAPKARTLDGEHSRASIARLMNGEVEAELSVVSSERCSPGRRAVCRRAVRTSQSRRIDGSGVKGLPLDTLTRVWRRARVAAQSQRRRLHRRLSGVIAQCLHISTRFNDLNPGVSMETTHGNLRFGSRLN
jgi:hypothetical protein